MRRHNELNLPENTNEAAVLAQDLRLIHLPQRLRLDGCRVARLPLVLNRFKHKSDLITTRGIF